MDDDPSKVMAVEAILAKLDQNIVTADSGREALRHCLDHDFAVILLDVRMPTMDGFETADLIRQRPRSATTPIIFVTAYGRTELDMLKGYAMGAVDYMFTPIVPEVLLAKVEVFVELFKKTEQIRQQAHQLAESNERLAQHVREISALNQSLTSANKELEAFAYSVSHDLRAPLRQIDGFIGILSEKYSQLLDDKGKEYMEFVRNATENMGHLIDDFLKLSQVSGGELARRRVDLSGVVQTIENELRQMDPDRNVEFVIHKDIFAVGDEQLLRIALQNLLGNAWKFTSKKPHAQIEFGDADREGKRVYFVRDNGAGFDMADSDKLFAPLHRLHSASEFPGTGIGLAIVARIIHRHGGEVWAESKVGSGATFYFTLG